MYVPKSRNFLRKIFDFCLNSRVCTVASDWIIKSLMKVVTTYLLVMMVVFTTQALDEDVTAIISGKSNHIVVFNTDRKFIGATVEVLDANGNPVVTQKLERRRMMIDFGLVRSGEYTIRVKIEDDVLEYRYVKK